MVRVPTLKSESIDMSVLKYASEPQDLSALALE